MIHECSFMNVLEVFFREPTSVHFVREIGRKISLAPTSVRNHVDALLESGMVVKRKAKPFDGYSANRDSEKFIFYKRLYNIHTTYELKKKIEEMHPRAIVLFGSYFLGEDIESSDIDIAVLSKTRNNINFSNEEKRLGRKINMIIMDNLGGVSESVRRKIKNGFVLHGDIDG